MAVAALVLDVSYLLLVFVLRSWLQWRRTGSTGFRGVSGRPGSLEWWGGGLFALAVLAMGAAPVLQLAGVLRPVPLLDGIAVQVTGLVLSVCGIVATFVAQLAMGASWRIGVDEQESTELVTGGMFARVRNPIFTALIVAWLGLALLTPNPLALAGLAALVAAVEIQVRAVEEPYLLRQHGAQYRRYAGQVGRFLPGLGRLRIAGGSTS
jgi:protein-S-isoprenylcysteine O-methyltransferase Ste14